MNSDTNKTVRISLFILTIICWNLFCFAYDPYSNNKVESIKIYEKEISPYPIFDSDDFDKDYPQKNQSEIGYFVCSLYIVFWLAWAVIGYLGSIILLCINIISYKWQAVAKLTYYCFVIVSLFPFQVMQFGIDQSIYIYTSFSSTFLYFLMFMFLSWLVMPYIERTIIDVIEKQKIKDIEAHNIDTKYYDWTQEYTKVYCKNYYILAMLYYISWIIYSIASSV